MSFDSVRYILFLTLVAALHRWCPAKARWALLLAASLCFYASWSLPLTLIIVGIILLTWGCGLLISKSASTGLRCLWCGVSIVGCMGMLFWFKYFNFVADTIFRIAGGTWEPMDIVLPIGCSFYTFQAVSYVLDVYRGKISAERHPGCYALYIAFFPQLVAGPIERAEALLPQLKAAPGASQADVSCGLKLIMSGLFRKLVIADMAAPAVDRVFSSVCPDGSAVFLSLILFAFQIYCDFAGYSEIAQGSACLVGIRLRRNFDRPYLARTVRGFWRRWHMSLTAWFTDYIYIPLGGNRSGIPRQAAAVMAVFLLSGLWHGANWTFVMWGLLHGILCVAEILLNRRERRGLGFLAAGQWLITTAAVFLSWLLFRAESLPQAAMLAGRLFSAWNLSEGFSLMGIRWAQAACLVLALLQLPLLDRLSRNHRVSDMTYYFLAAGILLAWVVRATGQGANAFIYFQF